MENHANYAEDDFRSFLSDTIKREKRKALWPIIRDHCSKDDDYRLSFPSRIFHSAKTLICILLKRQASLWGNPEIPHVSVGHWDYARGYFDHDASWTEVVVGVGFLSNWCYDIYRSNS